ncbi:hypothetical protein B005_5580 [Nocardiopsis alba ATCC BAA-2165]|uniref:Uncharacterized protein n=1 Tax=Nocardiopsis alba (strain ATCC BAA-2165 / BE74) TaxID=1205910 RepID=J7LFX9_NOCAA|nr:hypothetical protein B005_5580 [Nocardiopsis alba ATCC BAA-2165]
MVNRIAKSGVFTYIGPIAIGPGPGGPGSDGARWRVDRSYAVE